MAPAVSLSMPDKLAELPASGHLTQAQHDNLIAQYREDLDLALRSPITSGSRVTLSMNPGVIHAAAPALNTPELLESILVLLPKHTLRTRIPLVCKGFLAATHSSVRIRSILFLAADWKRDTVYAQDLPAPFKSLFWGIYVSDETADARSQLVPHVPRPQSWNNFAPLRRKIDYGIYEQLQEVDSDHPVRRHLLFQRPLTEIRGTLVSTQGRTLPLKLEMGIKNKHGLTYGELLVLIAHIFEIVEWRSDLFTDEHWRDSPYQHSGDYAFDYLDHVWIELAGEWDS